MAYLVFSNGSELKIFKNNLVDVGFWKFEGIFSNVTITDTNGDKNETENDSDVKIFEGAPKETVIDDNPKPSKLIRLKSSIFISRRKPEDKESAECIFINRCRAKEFFNEACISYASGNKLYIVPSGNKKLYNKWSNFIDMEYKKRYDRS